MRILVMFCLSVLFLLTACFKKPTYSEDLVSNIYDSAYVTDQWFEYLDYLNPKDTADSVTLFRFILKDVELPAINHGLSIIISEPNYGSQYRKGYSPASSNFKPFVFEVVNPVPGTEFCFTVGVSTVNESYQAKALHAYTECVTYIE